MLFWSEELSWIQITDVPKLYPELANFRRNWSDWVHDCTAPVCDWVTVFLELSFTSKTFQQEECCFYTTGQWVSSHNELQFGGVSIYCSIWSTTFHYIKHHPWFSTHFQPNLCPYNILILYKLVYISLYAEMLCIRSPKGPKSKKHTVIILFGPFEPVEM